MKVFTTTLINIFNYCKYMSNTTEDVSKYKYFSKSSRAKYMLVVLNLCFEQLYIFDWKLQMCSYCFFAILFLCVFFLLFLIIYILAKSSNIHSFLVYSFFIYLFLLFNSQSFLSFNLVYTVLIYDQPETRVHSNPFIDHRYDVISKYILFFLVFLSQMALNTFLVFLS